MFVIHSSCMSVGASFNSGPLHGGSLSLLTYLAELLFDYCYYCDLNVLLSWSQYVKGKMPAVPQGAFIARKVRQREMLVAKMHNDSDKDPDFMFYDKRYMELSPLKYNSKLMNSIWGLYNRYSVHNFKKNNDAEFISFTAGCQQSIVGNPASADRSSAVLKGTRSQTPLFIAEWLSPWEPRYNC